MANESAGIQTQLRRLFDAAVVVTRQQLEARHISFRVPVPQAIVYREPDRMSEIQKSFDVNVLTQLQIFISSPINLSSLDTDLDRCAEAIVNLADVSLPFWAPFPGDTRPFGDRESQRPDYSTNPLQWVREIVLLPALRYHLIALASIAETNEEHASAFAADVIDVVTDTEVSYKLSVPLAGLDLDAPALDLGRSQCRMRSLTPQEQAQVIHTSTGVGELFITWPDTALEVTVSRARDRQMLDGTDVILPFITSFLLHGFPISGQYYRQCVDPPWMSGTYSFAPISIPRRSPQNTRLSLEEFLKISETAQKLAQFNLREPSSPRDLALHRFLSGAARQTNTDGLLDLAIALEALLLPYDSNARHADLSYRFRLHGACYVADDLPSRQDIAGQLGKIYEIRSRLVHGGRYPDAQKIAEAQSSAMDICRRCLMKAILTGFPTPEVFRNLLLS